MRAQGSGAGVGFNVYEFSKHEARQTLYCLGIRERESLTFLFGTDLLTLGKIIL